MLDEESPQPTDEDTEEAPPRESMIRWADRALPRMSRLQFWVVLLLLVGVFLFGHGAIWEHPWDMAQVDSAIIWSYLAIPPVVLVCLLWSKRLGWKAFLLDTVELTFAKYGATLACALVMWQLAGPPPKHEAKQFFLPTIPVSDTRPPPSVLDPKTLGALRGRVLDAASQPLGGVSVYVAEGLEGYVFAPSQAPVSVTNDGKEILPQVTVVERYQTIEARSLDGHLHTLVAQGTGDSLFNIPLMSVGAPSVVQVDGPHEVATLRCSVHAHLPPETREKDAVLVVVSHPFHTVTDADGSFALDGVPSGALVVEAKASSFYDGQTAVTVSPQQASELVIHVVDRRLGGGVGVGL